MDETTAIIGGQGTSQRSTLSSLNESAILYGEGDSPRQKKLRWGMLALILISEIICFVLCIVHGVKKGAHYPYVYFLFASSQIGLAGYILIMVILMRRGDLGEGKVWFSYVAGFIAVLQTVFIDILVSH